MYAEPPVQPEAELKSVRTSGEEVLVRKERGRGGDVLLLASQVLTGWLTAEDFPGQEQEALQQSQ